MFRVVFFFPKWYLSACLNARNNSACCNPAVFSEMISNAGLLASPLMLLQPVWLNLCCLHFFSCRLKMSLQAFVCLCIFSAGFRIYLSIFSKQGYLLIYLFIFIFRRNVLWLISHSSIKAGDLCHTTFLIWNV